MMAFSLPVLLALAASSSAFTIQSATFLGNVTPTPNDNAVRDNGFSGKIGNTIIATFGDSFQCDNAYYQTGCQGIHYTYTNSAGLEKSPTTFQETPNATSPEYFCTYFSDESDVTHALGISNVVPTSSTAGVLYTNLYLRNGTEIGAGVASVAVSSSGVPSCTRLSRTWWNGQTEPWYGVYSAFLGASGGYIHAMGQANVTNAGGDYVYIARVPVGQATNLNSYQYWNGTGWQMARITAGQQYALRDTSGKPLTGVGQGQGMYNTYLKQYIYCDRNGLDYNVRCRTANAPEGPWSNPQHIFSSTEIGGCGHLPHYNGQTYAASFHPWYDASQKSVVMWFTCGPNINQAVNVTFA